MAITTRNEGYIGAKGGNVFATFLFDKTTNTLTTAALVEGTNFLDFGNLESSNVGVTASVQKFPSEDGIVRKTSSTFEGMYDGNAMETSKKIADWIAFTSRGLTLIAYKLQAYKNGLWQEAWGVGELENNFAFHSPDSGSGTPWKFNCLPRQSDVTLSIAQITTMRTALTISVGGISQTVPYPYYAGNLILDKNIEIEFTET